VRLIVVGAGGHASVVIDAAKLALPDCEVVGLVDDAVAVGERVSGSVVLGPIAEIDRFPHDAVALAVGDNTARARIFESLRTIGEQLPTLVHPSAAVAPSAKVGAGTVVLAHAVINAEAVVEDNVIVNTAATIDHHSRIGRHVHIAPGVHLAGGCRVGEGGALGIGTVVAPTVSIGARTFVGAGSVVLEDLPADVIAYGSPARVIRPRTKSDTFH
jgi:sugar O-acyltransferase (sialic acid O-acetyltransferase NeuD family)